MLIDAIGDNGSLQVELSAASATEIGTNEAQQSLGEVNAFNNLVTSGMTNVAINKYTPIPAVPFAAGQKIYMHTVISGTLTYKGGATLWFA
jgi:hypothetical protein